MKGGMCYSIARWLLRIYNKESENELEYKTGCQEDLELKLY